MKKTIYASIFFSLVALSTMSLTSCLKNSDDTASGYDDCAITAFTLGTLTRQLTDTTTSSYSGASCAFTIDQYKYLIYNKDSLIQGTHKTGVPCTITTRNSGQLYLMTGDSLARYFESGDTIDFSSGSRKMSVLSSNGQYFATYTITLNVHNEKEGDVTWYEPRNIADLQGADKAFADSILAPKERIIVSPTDTIVVIGKAFGKEYGISTATDSLYKIDRAGGAHIRENMPQGCSLPHSAISFIASPHGRNGITLLATDKGGKHVAYYKPNIEGEPWMQMNNEFGKSIPDSMEVFATNYGKYLVAITNNQANKDTLNHKFFISEDCGRVWKTNYAFTANGKLINEKVTAFATDENYILWIFTKEGKVYRCRQNSISWTK